jgi:hypothetical protein
VRMKSFPTVLGLAMAMVFAAPSTLLAQDAAQDEKKPEVKKEEPKKDPKIEEYEKALKDLKKIPGEFNFYQRKKDILLELGEKDFNKLFLLQASFNTGSSTNMTQPLGEARRQRLDRAAEPQVPLERERSVTRRRRAEPAGGDPGQLPHRADAS